MIEPLSDGWLKDAFARNRAALAKYPTQVLRMAALPSLQEEQVAVSQVAIQDEKTRLRIARALSLAQENERLRAEVLKLEWSANIVYELGAHRGYGVSLPACPVCKNFKSRGHLATCSLAAVLTPLRSV